MNAISQPGIGHNRPPVVDFYRDANALLPDYLVTDNVAITKRCDELMAAYGRAPAVIENDEIAGKTADFIRQIAACVKVAEDKRKADKEPTIEAGKLIDTFFSGVKTTLNGASTDLTTRVTAYLQKKARDELARRAEEERVAQAEAARIQREADEAAAAVTTETTLETAIVKEEQATEAQQVAQKASAAVHVRPAELSRTYSTGGSVASLKASWVGTIVNRETLDLNALRPYFTVAELEKALRAAVKAGIRKIEGAEIKEETKAGIR